jgi:hypothetical protein
MIEYGNIQQKTAIHDLRVDFLIWFKELYYCISTGNGCGRVSGGSGG